MHVLKKCLFWSILVVSCMLSEVARSGGLLLCGTGYIGRLEFFPQGSEGITIYLDLGRADDNGQLLLPSVINSNSASYLEKGIYLDLSDKSVRQRWLFTTIRSAFLTQTVIKVRSSKDGCGQLSPDEIWLDLLDVLEPDV